jgi:hypothetical protein
MALELLADSPEAMALEKAENAAELARALVNAGARIKTFGPGSAGRPCTPLLQADPDTEFLLWAAAMERDYVPKDGAPMSPAQQQELERRKAVHSCCCSECSTCLALHWPDPVCAAVLAGDCTACD